MSPRRYIPTHVLCSSGLSLLLCLYTNPSMAAPIDEFRISDLEQKVRELESVSREQARLISQLQGQPVATHGTLPAAGKTLSHDAQWLNAANWQRIKLGMSELQIIEILGPPTQLRTNESQGRSMFYAMEIGRSGFLVGKVDMRDGKSISVEIPRLK